MTQRLVDAREEILSNDITELIRNNLSTSALELLNNNPYQWNREIIPTILNFIDGFLKNSMHSAMQYIVVPFECVYPIWIFDCEDEQEVLWVLSLPQIQRLLFGYEDYNIEIIEPRKRLRTCATNQYLEDDIITNPVVLDKLAMLIMLGQFGAFLRTIFNLNHRSIDYTFTKKQIYSRSHLLFGGLITQEPNATNDEYINDVPVPPYFKRQRCGN